MLILNTISNDFSYIASSIIDIKDKINDCVALDINNTFSWLHDY